MDLLPQFGVVEAKKPLFSYLLFLLGGALGIAFLTDVPDILQEEWHYDNRSFFLLNFTLSWVLYCVLIDLFVRWTYVGWFIWIPFILFQGLRVYMYKVMGLQMIQNHVAVFMETNWNECSGYLTPLNICFLFVFLLFNVGLYALGSFLKPGTSILKNVLIILVELLALFGLGWHLCHRDTPHYCTPLRSILVTAYRAQMILQNGGTPELVHLRKIPTAGEGDSSCKPQQQPLTIIYVIGESVRPDHLQVNGYPRETTPHLAQRMKRGELLSFPNIMSYGTGTYEAMIGLLTNATNENPQPTVGSFIPLFNKHGYETSLVTNIPKGSVSTMSKLTEECAHFLYYESEYYDGLLEYMRMLRGDSPSVPQLILIQTNGSHYPYSHRYPHSSHAIFFPHADGTLSADNESIINSYDNSIIYADDMLNAVMNIFADTPTVLVYCSDHGESLGENGRFLHLGPLSVTEQRMVPLLIWGSESFRTAYHGMWENMRRRQTDMLQQGNLFHTILSLGGIESVWKREELDLTQPKERTRDTPDTVAP